MTYQLFDEKLQRLFEMNPQREQKLRNRWHTISRRGPGFFVVTWGSVLFLWMSFCVACFSFWIHTLRVYADTFVLASTAATMLLLSFMLSLAAYNIPRNMVAALDTRNQRLLRKLQPSR